MGEIKHTPAPWVCYPSGTNDALYSVLDQHANWLTTDDDVHEANARLIAAAPDLLEALEEQVDECFDDRCEMCARHQRVIAKAKGTA